MGMGGMLAAKYAVAQGGKGAFLREKLLIRW
jgi:hypothetical protein